MADTQAAPQIVKALAGVLPDGAVRQLMQALGNCNQPFTSRGPVNIQPNEPFGNNNGVFAGGRWNPATYQRFFPQPGTPGVDVARPGGTGYPMAGWTGGAATYNNYGGNNFLFPTNQAFNINNFYGGPTFNAGGNSSFDTVTAGNVITNNITVTGGFGGGGFGGEPNPGEPGNPRPPVGGAPGAGGGPFPIVFPPVWVNRPERPSRPGAQPPFSGRVQLQIPTKGELTSDCQVKLSFQPRTYTVTVR